MSDPRDDTFIQPTPEFAGLKLRPFSAGTMTLCRALNLSVVLGGAELSEEEKQKQLVALLFIQSVSLETVKRAVKVARTDYQAFLDDYLLPFELELPVSALPKIIADLMQTFADVNAAEFDVASEGGGPSHPNS